MGSLRLYTGNRLEALAGKLAEELRERRILPFETVQVVVQSRGMSRWLSMELAKKLGVCANIDFPFPKHFSQSLFEELIELPDPYPFSPDAMSWRLVKALPDFLGLPEFATLRAYLDDDRRQLKLFQLARRIGGIFDRYLVYRPDLITEWESGRNPLARELPGSVWQAVLWRRLSVDENLQEFHLAALRNRFIRELAAGRGLDRLPSNIYVFGISTLNPFYIDLFQNLSEYVDVDLYYLNPCSGYWEFALSRQEIAAKLKDGFSESELYLETGNPLLASMGIAGREFFTLINSMTTPESEADLFEIPPGESLLANLQRDILEMRDRGEDPKTPVPATDRSLRIHCCHSRIRELEALYDQILDMFSRNHSLEPRDIVVMAPDINHYAPLIDAVFGNPESEGSRIPYSVADQTALEDSPEARAFLELLDFPGKRFTAPEVMDFFECPAVHRRFGVEEDDLEKIRCWVADCNIRWGTDEKFRENLGFESFPENTWKTGLRRMLLGYALPEPPEPRLYQDILPYDMIEGDAAATLGAFAEFVGKLEKAVAEISAPKTLSRWSGILTAVLDDFFTPYDDVAGRNIQEIRRMLTGDGLARDAQVSKLNEPQPPEVIRAYLQEKLQGEVRVRGFVRGGVTFCTLMPMRSIPFKTVCLLGMNDSEFPRNIRRLNFDLAARKRRLGDSSPRLNDRFLFLEAMLSARENLLISYVGRNLKDNSEIPPSVLVSELLDYLERGFAVEAEGTEIKSQLVVEHRLQPFNTAYYSGDNRELFSYSRENCEAGSAATGGQAPDAKFFYGELPEIDPESWKVLHVNTLIKFFRNPAEFILRERLRLNLSLGVNNVILEDREPFDIDGLQAYQLKQELLESIMSGCKPGGIYPVLLGKGILPPGESGKILFDGLVDGVAVMAAGIMERLGGKNRLDPWQWQMRHRDSEITAEFSSVYEDFGQFFYRPANVRANDLLRTWIHHVFFNAQPEYAGPRGAFYRGMDKDFSFMPLDPAAAAGTVAELTDFFFHGLREPLAFFPETSLKFVESSMKGKGPDQALEDAASKWYGSDFAFGECRNEYFRKCFGEDFPDHEKIGELAMKIYGPMLANLEN